ncbi:MAG: hypothetical protein KC549_04495 [Myxococcales bacterium]|nr:hypothetical protein [Myxococcales bacterium]MCB9549062.1 hypothetical protein [Myxococcales bacterium]
MTHALRVLSSLGLILALALTLGGCGKDPQCKKGKPCGDTCIDKDKDCHQ